MTQNPALDEPIKLSAKVDPLDDVFDQPGQAKADAQGDKPRHVVRKRSGGWLVPIAASIVWIATVAAFCWSRYSLPNNASDAMDVVGTRISTGDWMMIAAAILGPLLLIWLAAWLIRRSNEMREESRALATAALRLAHVAQTAETGSALALTSGTMGGEITGETPRHLRREVERATHAISALHSQMHAIEEALSKQAAAIDDVAERAEKRARTISKVLSTEREALERTASAAGAMDIAPAAALGGIAAAGAGVAAGAGAIAGAGAATAAEIPSDIVDFSLDTEGDTGAALELTPDHSETVADLREQLVEAKEASTWERPTLSVDTDTPELADVDEALADRLDPFDDVSADIDGPSLSDIGASGVAGVGTGIGAAVGAGITGGAAAMAGLSSSAVEKLPDEVSAFDTLDLDTPAAEIEPLNLNRRHAINWGKFVRAANFPESEEDIETLDALYDVLTDPEAASLLQCAEDTLASLADIDLYMEDFIPQMMPVSAWRAYLNGDSDGALPIKGIHAPIEQSRIRSKLQSDAGFEHLCGKFTERYEGMKRRMLSETDEERLAVDLSNTRTGRAYLMIADAAGRF